MPRHVRWYLGKQKGKTIHNYNWDAINADSVVHITASEWRTSKFTDPDGSEPRFVGEFPIVVGNISPHGPPDDPNHGVTFVLTSFFWDGDPTPVVVDITVFDEPPEFVDYSADAREMRG
jgi:hypothetical protein